MEEAIDLVKGKAGIFPELKSPARLNARGVDVERAVADVLTKHGLVGAQVKGRPAVYLQSFEEKSVRRLAEILPAMPRTLLVGDTAGAARWLTPDGLREARTFATAVGPSRILIDRAAGASWRTPMQPVWRWCRTRSGRRAATGQAERDATVTAMRRFVTDLKVDGLFTDNPDLFPR